MSYTGPLTKLSLLFCSVYGFSYLFSTVSNMRIPVCNQTWQRNHRSTQSHWCSLIFFPLFSPGEKPFECKLCHQRSRDYSAMIKHLRTHNGASPYQCTICLEYCPSLSAMQKHMKGHKPEDIPPDWRIEKTYLYLCYVWKGSGEPNGGLGRWCWAGGWDGVTPAWMAGSVETQSVCHWRGNAQRKQMGTLVGKPGSGRMRKDKSKDRTWKKILPCQYRILVNHFDVCCTQHCVINVCLFTPWIIWEAGIPRQASFVVQDNEIL